MGGSLRHSTGRARRTAIGPRIRRTASARRRARQRAGLESADPADGANEGGAGGEQVNPDDLIAADVELEQMIMEDDEGKELSFWQFDKTDKIICGSICFLVVLLVIILAVAMS